VTRERPERPEATPRSRAESRAAARARMAQQHTWVDLQVRRAMERGDFDDLPGAGKPLKLDATHDPNWWIRKLVERENVAVLPPSLALRKEDAELDDTLDGLPTADEVRRHVADFNERVVAARYRLPEGPPLVTMPRDVEETVAAWGERRTARLAEQRAKARAALAEQQEGSKVAKRRWWSRRGGQEPPASR
jgi:hypothetical protein